MMKGLSYDWLGKEFEIFYIISIFVFDKIIPFPYHFIVSIIIFHFLYFQKRLPVDWEFPSALWPLLAIQYFSCPYESVVASHFFSWEIAPHISNINFFFVYPKKGWVYWYKLFHFSKMQSPFLSYKLTIQSFRPAQMNQCCFSLFLLRNRSSYLQRKLPPWCVNHVRCSFFHSSRFATCRVW